MSVILPLFYKIFLILEVCVLHLEDNEKIDINKVLEFATLKHKGQMRTDGTEYITHPVRVSELVTKFKPNSKNYNILKAGALLHDVLEDTYTSYRELNDLFGEVVASLVMEVTSSTFMPKLVGKQTYLAHKMRYMSPYALVIKLADRLDNLSDMQGMPIEKIKKTYFDTIYMIGYIESNRVLTDSQTSLIEAIREKLNDLNTLYSFSVTSIITNTDIDQK